MKNSLEVMGIGNILLPIHVRLSILMPIQIRILPKTKEINLSTVYPKSELQLDCLFSVVKDPDSISQWIRIRIQIGNPDPEGQKLHT